MSKQGKEDPPKAGRGLQGEAGPVDVVAAKVADLLRADLDAQFSDLAAVIEAQAELLFERHRATKPLLSVKDLAKTLGISQRKLETLIAAGELAPLWIGGQRRFHPDAIDAYLRQCERRGRKRRAKRRGVA